MTESYVIAGTLAMGRTKKITNPTPALGQTLTGKSGEATKRGIGVLAALCVGAPTYGVKVPCGSTDLDSS